MAFSTRDSRGDSVDLDLEYNSSSLEWKLYAEVVFSGNGSNGEYGLAAVRALIDNVPVSTVTLASGIGAINPINQGGPNQRPAAIATQGGTIDIIYLQNLAAPVTVVEGVGVGSRRLIASGSFLNPTIPPSFGNDDFGYTSDGNFLNRTAPSQYGGAFPWDAVSLAVIDITPQGVDGDYNNDGTVNLADYTVWRDRLGSPAGSLENDPHTTVIGAAQYNTWRSNFGLSMPSSSLASQTVPEPSTLLLAVATVLLVASQHGSYRRIWHKGNKLNRPSTCS
ncbi:hypothetical protein [Aeoliella sp. SH292]|uniref:hypothetical protein n=1 Tax=Aeoliella sp. SH292 TaxID=3454464 RepID=UPI003F9D61B9